MYNYPFFCKLIYTGYSESEEEEVWSEGEQHLDSDMYGHDEDMLFDVNADKDEGSSPPWRKI